MKTIIRRGCDVDIDVDVNSCGKRETDDVRKTTNMIKGRGRN